MILQVNNYLLAPASPSGRDDWWTVFNGRTCWLHSERMPIPGMQLDVYIVARAEAGCPDCISAILECPNDMALVRALAKEKIKS